MVSLNQTFKRALSRRYFLSLDVTLQLFWCKILIYDFQIRKVHAKTRLVVMFSSHQLISTTKNFFDKKNFFHENLKQKSHFRAFVFYMMNFEKSTFLSFSCHVDRLGCPMVM